MPLARIHAKSGELRSVIVCIDSYEDKLFSGRLVSGQDNEERPFNNLMQFLQEMDDVMDDLDVPPSAMEKRIFNKPDEESLVARKTEGRQINENAVGKVATFNIRILFRQNASWQGSVSWIEGNNEQTYRSALELLMLMDSAMSQ